MANTFETLLKIPMVTAGLKDLGEPLVALQADPEFKKAIGSSKNLKAQSDAISKDARDITNAFK